MKPSFLSSPLPCGQTVRRLRGVGVWIILEKWSVKKEAAKEEAKKQEMRDLQSTIGELFIHTEEHDAQIRELTRKIHDIGTNVGT
ncbi:unnamed protein product [Acanthoscelides obtectus]|uniref:Uncharacterized protein n=1 Tax=Acanthoscelides obtectus TaxID=200917 RepID=A0A9P0LUU3_ACAOB|nr:unnamed protein product [Acanthoscelides obtectus]CAK1624305.1 hypothetical protein AOBTE_LOCUS2481 [Acanthoscelides obtectus]